MQLTLDSQDARCLGLAESIGRHRLVSTRVVGEDVLELQLGDLAVKLLLDLVRVFQQRAAEEPRDAGGRRACANSIVNSLMP